MALALGRCRAYNVPTGIRTRISYGAVFRPADSEAPGEVRNGGKNISLLPRDKLMFSAGSRRDPELSILLDKQAAL